MAQILDGKILADNLKEKLKAEVGSLKQKTGISPRLVSVLVGNDEASLAYANSQKKTAESLGLSYDLVTLSASITQQELASKIKELNADESVNGIMIYRPLPKNIDDNFISSCVDTVKDVEGLNAGQMGKILLGGAKILPCTAAAVIEHVKSLGMDLRGKEAVVVGRSEIVGKPVALLLQELNATVTTCHSGTTKEQLQKHIERADILVVAVGNPNFVPGDWVKKGAVVIDVGINRVEGKIVGDVDFEKASVRASYITPVPGGVGPVTVVILMRNGVEAFKMQYNERAKVSR